MHPWWNGRKTYGRRTTTMPIARPLLKYDRLKTRITTLGNGLSANRITDPTPITLSVRKNRSNREKSRPLLGIWLVPNRCIDRRPSDQSSSNHTVHCPAGTSKTYGSFLQFVLVWFLVNFFLAKVFVERRQVVISVGVFCFV